MPADAARGKARKRQVGGDERAGPLRTDPLSVRDLSARVPGASPGRESRANQ